MRRLRPDRRQELATVRTVCHEHGTVYAGGVLGLVQRAARRPEEWCEECERAWARSGAS
jgi:hypothetical protein